MSDQRQKLSLEILSAAFHKIYQDEMRRQGRPSVHADSYSDLPEHVKDLDRALARFVLDRDRAIEAAALKEAAKSCTHNQETCKVHRTCHEADAICIEAMIDSSSQLAFNRMLEEAQREMRERCMWATRDLDGSYERLRVVVFSAPDPPAEEEK